MAYCAAFLMFALPDHNTILLLVGSFLLVVGVLGGGLEFKDVKVPPIEKWTRLIAVVLGASLVVFSLGFLSLLSSLINPTKPGPPLQPDKSIEKQKSGIKVDNPPGQPPPSKDALGNTTEAPSTFDKSEISDDLAVPRIDKRWIKRRSSQITIDGRTLNLSLNFGFDGSKYKRYGELDYSETGGGELCLLHYAIAITPTSNPKVVGFTFDHEVVSYESGCTIPPPGKGSGTLSTDDFIEISFQGQTLFERAGTLK